MTLPSSTNLAPIVRAVCLLLCFALLTPPVTIAAALGSAQRGGALRAASGSGQQSGVPASGGAAAFAAAASFSAGNAPSEAALPNGIETGAKRAGEKLAASTVPVRLRKTVDKYVAGKQSLKLSNTQNKNNALAAFAAPERVFSIAPTATKPAAAAANMVAPAADKTTPEVVRVVKAPASTAKAGAEQLSAVAELGKSIATEKVAKENHVPNLSRDAVSPGVSADPGRDLVSGSPKMSPEMVTPSTLDRQISSTNKAEQVAKFDAPALPGVFNASNAATLNAPELQRAVSLTSPVVAPSLETKAADAPATLSAAKSLVVAETTAPESVEDTATATDAKLEAAASTAAPAAAMTAAFAPANDNFALAQVVSGLPGSTTGSNIGATKEAGEPYHAFDRGGASVWFKWQATATRSIDFSTAGSGFDTVLAVYQGTSVSALREVASNDEVSATDSTSRVTFDAVAGQIYYIAVDGFFDG